MRIRPLRAEGADAELECSSVVSCVTGNCSGGPEPLPRSVSCPFASMSEQLSNNFGTTDAGGIRLSAPDVLASWKFDSEQGYAFQNPNTVLN